MNLILNFCPDYYEFRGHHSIKVSLPQTQPEDEGWSRFSAVNFAAQIWHLHVTCHRRINQKNLLLLLRSSRVGFLIIFNSTRRVGVEIKHAVARTISRCFEATICGPRNWFSFSFSFFFIFDWLLPFRCFIKLVQRALTNQSEVVVPSANEMRFDSSRELAYGSFPRLPLTGYICLLQFLFRH